MTYGENSLDLRGSGKHLLLALTFVFPCLASSQTPARCMPGGVTLQTVERSVRHDKETTTLALLKLCHVGFQLDAHAIETLTAAQASLAVMDLLNQATAPLLNLEQAHMQADQIERRLGGVQSADTLTAFRERLALLKQRLYADPRPVGTLRYDASYQQLSVLLGAEEYVFLKVDAGTENTLSANWKEVRVVRPYDEDADRSRTLTLALPTITQKGMPVPVYRAHAEDEYPKVVEDFLSDGRKLVQAGNYETAIDIYNLAYAMKPNWETHNTRVEQALQGLDAAKKVVLTAKQGADLLRAKGEWLDLGTPAHLIWTIVDNGQDINWKEAGKYCKTLQTGGATGWRLPTEAELQGIADKSVTSMTAPTVADFFYQTPEGKLDKIPKGKQWDYHVSGKIVLSTARVWSATLGGHGGARVTNFNTLESQPFPQTEKRLMRVLCVRTGD